MGNAPGNACGSNPICRYNYTAEPGKLLTISMCLKAQQAA
jgi:hypothetical protein